MYSQYNVNRSRGNGNAMLVLMGLLAVAAIIIVVLYGDDISAAFADVSAGINDLKTLGEESGANATAG